MKTESLSPARLEAFSDGVFSVVMTILVLELKVPAHDGWAGLRAVWPTLFLYLLTFLQAGIYWVNHHYLLDETETVKHGVLWTNLAFLFALSLFPFATEWVGARGLTPFATAMYAGVSLLPGLAFFILAREVRKVGAAPPHSGDAKQIVSLLAYLIAIPAAYWHTAVSLALLSAIAFVWILPPRGTAPVQGAAGERDGTERTGPLAR